MKTSDLSPLEQLLILHEDLRLERYKCPAGKTTIGVGHNLDARPIPGLPEKITEEKALEILAMDLSDTHKELEASLPWVLDTDEVRYAVLVDMAFNLGVGGLLKFEKTLAAFERGDWIAASLHMADSKWHKQVKDRARRLEQMVVSGKWPAEVVLG